MKFLNITSFIILILLQSTFAGVAIEEMNVDAEFFGVWNRTKLEFILHNSTKIDSERITIELEIHSTSFVSDMWLEINGELKQAETFSRKRAEYAQDSIILPPINSAQMLKEVEGVYLLNVFPVNAGETRRVVVEYHSTLEYSAEKFPSWFISLQYRNVKRINFNFFGDLPSGTCVMMQGNKRDISSFKRPVHFVKKDAKIIPGSNGAFNVPEIKAEFDFTKTNKNPFIVRKDNSLLLDHETRSFSLYIPWDYEYVPTLITSLISRIKTNNELIVEYGRDDQFLSEFIHYVNNRHGLIKIKPQFGLDQQSTEGWRKNHTNHFFLSALKQADPDLYQDKIFYPPFMNFFLKHKKAKMGYLNKKGSGFLFRDISKLVVEEDERVLSIRKEETVSDKLTGRSPQFVNVHHSTGNVDIVSDGPPEPIGGRKAVQSHLIYPLHAQKKGLEGCVVLDVLIEIDGSVLEAKIYESFGNNQCDEAAIMAIKSVKWKPDAKRGVKYRARTLIPVFFKLDQMNENTQNNSTSYEIHNKSFVVFEDHGKFIFKGPKFNDAKFTTIEYMSDSFFELMFEKPSFIKYAYEIMHNLNTTEFGLNIKGKSYYFARGD